MPNMLRGMPQSYKRRFNLNQWCLVGNQVGDQGPLFNCLIGTIQKIQGSYSLILHEEEIMNLFPHESNPHEKVSM